MGKMEEKGGAAWTRRKWVWLDFTLPPVLCQLGHKPHVNDFRRSRKRERWFILPSLTLPAPMESLRELGFELKELEPSVLPTVT